MSLGSQVFPIFPCVSEAEKMRQKGKMQNVVGL